MTVFATVVLNKLTAALFVATLLLKLATSVNAPAIDPLKALTLTFVLAISLLKLLILDIAPDKLLLIFATSKFVLDILPANIPKPGTVGAVAVPDKSPAN
jgi:hypothetical protein